jgi:transcriptional regulator with XRE-family HTH domain
MKTKPPLKTQPEIALEVGISVTWLSNIVNGRNKRPIDIDLAQRSEKASDGRYRAVDLIPGAEGICAGRPVIHKE